MEQYAPIIVVLGLILFIGVIVFLLISRRKEEKEEEEAEAALTPEERIEREKRVQNYIKDSAVNEARIRGRRGVGIY